MSKSTGGKLHLKGFILTLLQHHSEGLWDFQIAQQTLDEYNCATQYWRGEIRASLTDLFSSALIEELEDKLDDDEYFGSGKVLVKFRLTDFGRERMRQTGLLDTEPNSLDVREGFQHV